MSSISVVNSFYLVSKPWVRAAVLECFVPGGVLLWRSVCSLAQPCPPELTLVLHGVTVLLPGPSETTAHKQPRVLPGCSQSQCFPEICVYGKLMQVQKHTTLAFPILRSPAGSSCHGDCALLFTSVPLFTSWYLIRYVFTYWQPRQSHDSPSMFSPPFLQVDSVCLEVLCSVPRFYLHRSWGASRGQVLAHQTSTEWRLFPCDGTHPEQRPAGETGVWWVDRKSRAKLKEGLPFPPPQMLTGKVWHLNSPWTFGFSLHRKALYNVVSSCGCCFNNFEVLNTFQNKILT